MFGLFLLIGLGLIVYPIFSNLLVSSAQSAVQAQYTDEVSSMENTEIEEELEAARLYNEALLSVQGTKPLMLLPTHSFLFHPGINCNPGEFQRALNVQPWEYDLIRIPNRGHCLYKCGNERYHLHVRAPAYKAELFGTAGGK